VARLRLDVDTETYQHLVTSAVAERRPIPWQAAILLRRALGLPFPDSAAPTHQEKLDAHESRSEASHAAP
jgi:hypothetical protein